MKEEYRKLTIQQLEDRAKSIEQTVKHYVECGKWDIVSDAEVIKSDLALVKNLYDHADWLRMYVPKK